MPRPRPPGNKTVNKANIVLFGYFADDTQTAADAYFDQYAGELVGYIDGSFGRSLKNYLSSISYGQLQMKNTIPSTTAPRCTPCKSR